MLVFFVCWLPIPDISMIQSLKVLSFCSCFEIEDLVDDELFEVTPSLSCLHVAFIIFFLNVSAEVCRERMNKRNEPAELFETKLDTYRNKYLSAIKYLQQERQHIVIEIFEHQNVGLK